MATDRFSLPLFPLHSVLFPDGPISLRIFEARYLDMVSRCLKEETGFGVVLIRTGQETGPAQVVNLGTVATIRDWDRLDDGLLGITALGERRFRVESVSETLDGLNIGEVTLLDEPPVQPVPGRFRHLSRLLEELLPRLPKPWRLVTPNLDDASWVGYRLAEILPLNMGEKQRLLAMNDPAERLEAISRYFERDPDIMEPEG